MYQSKTDNNEGNIINKTKRACKKERTYKIEAIRFARFITQKFDLDS